MFGDSNDQCTKNDKKRWPKNLVTFTEEIFNGKLHFFVQWISKKRFNKASKLCKSSKCFDSEAMLSWSSAKVNFFL